MVPFPIEFGPSTGVPATGRRRQYGDIPPPTSRWLQALTGPSPRFMSSGMDAPFWKTKKLEEMSRAEWEALCDGCGKCCMAKLEDADTGEIYWTSVSCRLFDAGKCRCTDYRNRLERVPDCVGLTPDNVRNLPWLPATCAYRLIAEGKDLYWWHRLVSGSEETVHEAGISIRGRVSASEDDMPDAEAYFDFMLADEP
jgi:uncharacterized cysteine cluster protein YcgN (CxxCxxCC family)